MRGEFIVIPIAASGSGIFGLVLLFGLAGSLGDNASKMGDHFESIQMTTLKRSTLVKTVQVNEIKNNQATVSIGVNGPYLACSHSPNVTIEPIVSDKARIHYMNNRFSWRFYINSRRINNVADFYLIYHDSPHGQVELFCNGRGWDEGTGAIKFVLLPPHNEMRTTAKENDPLTSNMASQSNMSSADPNIEASILQQQAEDVLHQEDVPSEPPLEAQGVSVTKEAIQEELTPTQEAIGQPEQPLRPVGKLSSEELEKITLIEMQKMRDGH